MQHGHRNIGMANRIGYGMADRIDHMTPLPDVHSALGMPQEDIRAHRGLHQLYQHT